MSLSSSSGIKHVVRRLCLVSKDKLMDKMMHKETSVYVIDSIMRHADKEKNEELRQKYERHLQLHLRNIFKRAIRNDATRSHLAEKFMHKILLKWKEKGWFANELQSIVDVISKAAPDLEQPEELKPTYGANQEDEPSPIAVPAGHDSSWLMGRSGATAKAGAPPTPAQPVFLHAPGTPGPDGLPMASPQMANTQVLYSVPSTPNFKVENVLNSVPATPHVLNSVPATPRVNMGMSVPATPNVGNIPQTPVQGRIPQTPVGNAMLGRIPSTPMAAAMPMTPAGGGALLTIPRTPGAGVLGSVPQTPGAPGAPVPQTPGGFGTVPATPRAMPSTPAMGRIPSTPRGAGIPATPHLAVPATPNAGRIPATPIAKKEETAPVTPAAAFGGMTPAGQVTPGFQPFFGAGQVTPTFQPFSAQAMPSTPQGLAKAEPDMDMDLPVPSEEPPTAASVSVPSAEPSVEQPVPSVEQPVPSAEPPSVEQPVPSVEQPVPSVGAAGVAPILPAEEVQTLDVPQPGEELTAEVPSLPSVPSVPSSVPSNASAGSEAKRRRLTVKLGEQSGREQTEK